MAFDVVELQFGWVVQWVGISGTLYRSGGLLQTKGEAELLARTLADGCLHGCNDAADDRAAETVYSVFFTCEDYVQCPCSE